MGRLPTAITVSPFPEDMLVREVLRRDGGIGMLPTFLTDDDVVTGRLLRVLPKHEKATARVFLVMPERKYVPARVTAFRDLVVELLRQRPPGRGADVRVASLGL